MSVSLFFKDSIKNIQMLDNKRLGEQSSHTGDLEYIWLTV